MKRKVNGPSKKGQSGTLSAHLQSISGLKERLKYIDFQTDKALDLGFH
jgi:hypothetical protein